MIIYKVTALKEWVGCMVYFVGYKKDAIQKEKALLEDGCTNIETERIRFNFTKSGLIRMLSVYAPTTDNSQ